MVKDSIVVVGGGTAGWLTALFAKKKYPSLDIILIESDEIGILGAGEGTTPYFHTILDFIDISYADVIRNCQASFKVGLKYTNWSKNSPEYYHTFETIFYKNLETSIDNLDRHFFIECYRNKELPVLKTLTAECCKRYRLPVIQPTENLDDTLYLAPMAMHFDASLLAKYFKSIGLSRGIIRQEGKVISINQNNQGYIESVTLNNGIVVNSTFIFDCTGFKRLIIGNFYKSEWQSLKEMLPAKRALAFFTEQTDTINPYTDVIAGNYGWFWKIPLQHRHGCGYVFDSEFINDDLAKKEIDNLTGQDTEIRNTFNFEPGYYSEIWIKNCIAMGLSSGFLEPLEATSILQLGRNLLDFFTFENKIYERDQRIIDEYNSFYAKETNHIAEFLYLHYVTDKTDTDFWVNFTKNNKMPETIKEILNIVNYRLLNSRDIKETFVFSLDNYLSILCGNNQIKALAIENSFKQNTCRQQAFLNLLFENNERVKQCIDHKKFIKLLHVTA
jgi:tryptophan halogenase